MHDRLTLRTKLLLVSLIVFSSISALYFMNSRQGQVGPEFFTGLRDGIIGVTVGIWFFGLIFLSIRKRKARQQGRPVEEKNQTLLTIGLFSMVCGILLNRFGGCSEIFAGISIIFFIISAVTSLVYIRKIRLGKNVCE
ncbi:MAG: hypothetical protein DWQ10_06025 [Calditrichaeota bacterium]|nr:MAG: hypothetical protein DWQ10_06025 [Calditrichota bacterium]